MQTYRLLGLCDIDHQGKWDDDQKLHLWESKLVFLSLKPYFVTAVKVFWTAACLSAGIFFFSSQAEKPKKVFKGMQKAQEF